LIPRFKNALNAQFLNLFEKKFLLLQDILVNLTTVLIVLRFPTNLKFEKLADFINYPKHSNAAVCGGSTSIIK